MNTIKQSLKLSLKKDDRNKWKNVPCSWIGGFHVVKIDSFPQIDQQIEPSPSQNPS